MTRTTSFPRYAAALGAVVIATLLLSSTAFAFSIRNAGFTATTYATGFVADTSGHGPRATAWEANVLWSVDSADGGLYRADAGAAGPGPLTALVATRVNPLTPIVGGPNGIAVGLDGRLYATLLGAQTVVELSKADGGIARTLTTASSLACPSSLATDPLSGDLLVTSCSAIWRIASPATAATATRYALIANQYIPTTAITIGPDGTLFVVSPFGIYAIGSTAQATPLVSPISSLLSGVTGLAVATDGVATVPLFLFVSTADGSIYKIPGLGISSSTSYLVLDGSGAGEQLSRGPDRCVYASMGAAVLRVADVNGLCELAQAGVQVPSLTLANTTGQDAHINGAYQMIAADLAGATVPGEHVVTFTVTGVNGGTYQGTTSTGGIATFTYQGHVEGTDTIVATTTVDGFSVTSLPLTLVWLPQIDLAAPTISFSYTVPAGGTASSFTCPLVTSQTQSTVACGWFTRAPTIHWTVTANGPSGLGAITNCQDYTLDYQPGVDGHHQICRATNGDGQASANLTVIINAILTPPTIAAIATDTSTGAAYLAGTPTRGPVTVHFTCNSAIAGGVLSCPLDQTYSGTGTYAASGSVTDVAGQTASVAFGLVVIDSTPPTISASALSAGAPYNFGTWTSSDVVITFTCADNRSVASCTSPVTVSSSATGVTGTVTDGAGNSASFTTGPVLIDKTPPTISATATNADGTPYTAGTTTPQDVIVHFTCGTDGAPLLSCGPDVTLTASGSVTGAARDAAGLVATAVFGPVVIDRNARVHTALAITSSPFIAAGGAVTARLTTVTGLPLAGETVRFGAGGLAPTATTDATGSASVTLTIAPGVYTVSAAYDGSTRYFPSTATSTTVTVYQMTQFVVWGANRSTIAASLPIGTRVQFYGSKWAKQITAGPFTGQRDFKGWATTVTPTSWTGWPGDSPLQPKQIAQYIGVIVTTQASTVSGATVGNIAGVAILRVDRYDGKVGSEGFGFVLGLGRAP